MPDPTEVITLDQKDGVHLEFHWDDKGEIVIDKCNVPHPQEVIAAVFPRFALDKLKAHAISRKGNAVQVVNPK